VGHVKLYKSGNLVEIYQYQYEISNRVTRKKKSKGKYYKSSSRRFDNVFRQRKLFTRIVRSNLDGIACPALLTLTMFERVGIKSAYGGLKRFVWRSRLRFGKGFKYVAVPEFQKRGAVHFHVLVWGFPQEIIDHERDTRFIQRLWSYGYVDIVSTDGSSKLAGYLAKYMSKSMQDERLVGEKAFATSRNVLRPVSLSFKSALDHVGMMWGVDNSNLVRISKFSTIWLGECEYKSHIIN